MKINAIAPWFGSKRTLALRIVEAIGPHKVYWEPFVGSMAVLLAKAPAKMETVNDMQRFTKTRVVVSYYDHPELARLYPGWKKVGCSTTKAMVSSGKRDTAHATVAPEVLLINDRSVTDNMFE
jgi:hypothetical protein